MDFTARRSAQLAAILMIATVATQIIYFALYSNGMDINRMVIWTTEAVAFLGIGVFALAVAAKAGSNTVAWSAIAAGGLLNVVQVGMGLAMFAPLSEAGEALAPAFQSVLAGAFFLYFAGKFLFGAAAILIGLGAFKTGSGAGKAIGGLAVLGGIAAMVTNVGGMAVGMDMVFPAGAAGTAATLFLGLIAAKTVAEGE